MFEATRELTLWRKVQLAGTGAVMLSLILNSNREDALITGPSPQRSCWLAKRRTDIEGVWLIAGSTITMRERGG